MFWIELTAAILSALGVWLTALRHPLCWPIGLVSVLIYGWIFIDVRLYSDALLQVMFGAMIIYGWVRWMHHLDDGGRVRIATLARRQAALHLLAGIAGALLLGYVMQRWTNAALPWLDASLTALSLVAQWWQARRHIAAWWLWIAVDVVYIGLYVYKDLFITSVLYAGFVVLAVFGLQAWQRASRPEAAR